MSKPAKRVGHEVVVGLLDVGLGNDAHIYIHERGPKTTNMDVCGVAHAVIEVAAGIFEEGWEPAELLFPFCQRKSCK